MAQIKTFKKVLVANRGEIAIRIFRACTELGIRTVAVYSEQDNIALHRFKADEAYVIGEGKGPIEAYLDIEGIIEIAKRHDVDAIHPGYGFLSENEQFARRCEEEGITFIGPTSEHIRMFGDKVTARQMAIEAGIPVIPGTPEPVRTLEEALRFVKEHGYPIIIKASSGGGGRGMRIVRKQDELQSALDRARSEAKSAFGNPAVYLEKYLEHPKHIEVQILADRYGHAVHLFERDCSIQRRHQKVVEVAPSLSLTERQREDICNAALRLAKTSRYINAGTVEFLVTPDGNFYFIEVNPRIQVEHTITEMITGIDIVQSQIRIAEGYALEDPEVGIPSQSSVQMRGYAIQSRVTTEDPENNFLPDTGRLLAYRSASGFGVRLDAGIGAPGATITPYYDSLLVKVSTHALTFERAARKMLRTLKEFRIRGVKTNIPFLENVMQHPDFLRGTYDTSFIDTKPELFEFPKRKDRGTKLLTYIGQTIVNGHPGLAKMDKKPTFPKARIPETSYWQEYPVGTKQILDEHGPEGVVKWIQQQKKLLLTDTTFRDAHQSLLATRVRTYDLLQIAEATGKLAPDLFSLEMWGGATFDTSMRFLNEDPWERLLKLREKIPNLLFQMLFRGANAVGYTNYPDNVIQKFIETAARAGIDVFRIFDSLNWVEGMRLAIETVRETGKIAEAAICYTGDILNPKRDKYNLKYYVNLAKELEKAGAHILAIKDMAGLLKPYAAYELIKALKQEIGIPIHLHTHDTSGNAGAMLLKASEAGVDIVDVALSSMSGLTSQPSLNAIAYALEHHERTPGLCHENYQKLADYWEDVRKYYVGFETEMKASNAEVYKHEMPGGQYTNLEQQAKAVGLGDRWGEVKEMYATVNRMFGDIVKVTPSSKVVGDMALFMVQNNLNEQNVYEKGETIDFPESVITFFQGYLGQPYGGFPEELQRIILKGREAFTTRPGELLPSADFDEIRAMLEEKLERSVTDYDLMSYVMYPQVFLDMQKRQQEFGDVSVLDTPTFFYGLRLGEEIAVDIEQGKTLIVKLVSIGEVRPDGMRTIYYELNGQPREINVRDASAKVTTVQRAKADPSELGQIGASMPGKVLKIMVEQGDKVKKGEHVIVTEAMKMETTMQAPFDGVVKEIHVKEGDSIETGDLLLVIVKK
ncbi:MULTISPECIES: pyruvate carboxylase [Aneurinibacillus]|uniref:Pyruvate carboxylase n=1 Tax=Aneurinibacillus thermoaerophilus TaxID=143495 RepID=A0A1G7YS71_ANETH|nr:MULTISPECIES: pyruvate carboxylase [Aneurinibacillus]AMA73758.1 pyruvate carboxylase [Aneurinibacillus sp. XH2]MED0677115.1 pyruvate carboxylase [Aneurinibacillus thermoaerophilus]MED0738004.1 pyruvate carboxylase [Aneurinibacillus thermoaerophilus]MED0756425.1 pyruvate carboxylase [Aneurinibacillus thermoaerophilus]MED0761176.1 pyruvate carboxylase [Aneurinibacillus thermoaerophilus]